MRLLPWVFIGRGWTCLIHISSGKHKVGMAMIKNNGGLGFESST